jgi:hypothetical protein
MTAVGQTRLIDTLPALAVCPLRSNRYQIGASQRTVALCQERPNAPQQNLPKRVQAIYARAIPRCAANAKSMPIAPTPALALTGASEETVYELIECLCPLKIHGVATLRYEINLGCRHEAGKDLRQEEWVSGILAANDEKSRRR